MTRFLVAEARLLGVPMPPLSFLPPNDFTPVAEDIARARSAGRLSLATGMVSSCVRVAAAAIEKGFDISGTRFCTAGEALTDAKAEVVRRAGAEAFATYWISELGLVGSSCSQTGGANRVHLFHDAVAAITHRHAAPGTDAEVSSLLFTSLLPFAPFFVINLEIGDHGVFHPASCDCEFSRAGFTTMISDIYSFTKLTGYGTTLVGDRYPADSRRGPAGPLRRQPWGLSTGGAGSPDRDPHRSAREPPDRERSGGGGPRLFLARNSQALRRIVDQPDLEPRRFGGGAPRSTHRWAYREDSAAPFDWSGTGAEGPGGSDACAVETSYGPPRSRH